MRKLFFFIFTVLFVFTACEFKDLEGGTTPFSEDNGGLTVTFPNGGDSLMIGGFYNLTWLGGVASNVKIEYSVDGGNIWKTIAESVANSGSYHWGPVPSVNSSKLLIKVSSTDGQESDMSDATANIVENVNKVVILTAPNGGDSLIVGDNFNIEWISSKIEKLKIEYSDDNGNSWNTIEDSYLASNYSYLWQPIPNVYSTNCLIKLSDASDNSVFDISDSKFNILIPKGIDIMVLVPNGGETWNSGTKEKIIWYSKDVIKVKIEYTANEGSDWITLVDNYPNTGVYYWEPIPEIESSISKIRVSNADNPQMFDESDKVFSISPEPYVKVISPNGGESLQAGSSQNISWTSANIKDVKIEFSINNGAQWEVITPSTPSDGNYTWENIPDANSSLCRIRISDAKDGMPSDTSDANFEIVNQIVQNIELTSPNGGEEWISNTPKVISWTSTGVDKVKIEYTSNNGIEWNQIITDLKNVGSFEWITPNIQSEQMKIRVSDAEDANPADESDGGFTIKKAPSIKLLTPLPGEIITAGEPYLIKWEAVNVENVKIELTTNDGYYNPDLTGSLDDDYTFIIENTPAGTGQFQYIFSTASKKCKIRIGDASQNFPGDFSGLFTVKEALKRGIHVSSPNGGEKLIAGETYEIRWEAYNVEKVKIQYTLNQTDWKTIVDSVYNNGTYYWTVPQNLENKSLIASMKISDVRDSTVYDISDTLFTMYPPKYLRLLFPVGGEYISIKVAKDGDTLVYWESAGITNVNIDLSRDNGVTWSRIASNVSAGGYNWRFVNYPFSHQARLRVTDASADAGSNPLTDASKSYFHLNIAGGGSKANLGDDIGKAKIQWEEPKASRYVDIYYSDDNGKTWQIGAKKIKSKIGNNNFAEIYNLPKNKNLIFKIKECNILKIDK